jgi:hypothetical protein
MPHWRRKMGSWSAQSLFLVGKRYGEVRKFPFVGSRAHTEVWRLSESFSSAPMRKGKATPSLGPYRSLVLRSQKLN